MPRPLPPRATAQLLLLLTVLVWGSTFTLVKSALADISPLLFNLLRFALASLALVAINRRHLGSLTPAQFRLGALTGLLLAAGYQFQTLGLAYTTPAKCAVITGLVVVFVPLLTFIPGVLPASSPHPGLPAASGAVLAFAGLLLLTTPAGTRPAELFSSIGRGDLLTLFCAFCFATHLLTLARASRQIDAGPLATLQIGFAALTMLFTQPLEHARFTATPRLILTLAVCAFFATAAAFTVQSFAQSILPPTQTVVILTLEPVFGWLTSLVFLGEVLSRRSLLGAALILTAILVIEFLPVSRSTEIPS